MSDEVVDVVRASGAEATLGGGGVQIGGRWWSPVALAHPSVGEVLTHARPGVLVVADRLSREVREVVAASGGAWLDRRGSLFFPGSPPWEASFLSRVAPPERVVEVFTNVGFDVAVTMLSEPTRGWGVHELARITGRSPGRVSELLGALRDQGLVDRGGHPLVPELFWEASDAWRPRWRPLHRLPVRDGATVVGGTRAAVAWGAPLIATGDSPVELYFSDRRALDRLVRHDSAGKTVGAGAVCPSPLVTRQMVAGAPEVAGFPVGNIVVVAFDLARDRGRGHEILDAWTPSGGRRVW